MTKEQARIMELENQGLTTSDAQAAIEAEDATRAKRYEDIGHLIPSLDRYLKFGIMPGDFLTGVLENNLMKAVGHADSQNVLLIPLVCKYLYNEMPNGSHGSPEKVEAWYITKLQTGLRS